MNSAARQGVLSVANLIALQDGSLRVQLPGGSFKVVHRQYKSGSKVYDGSLPVAVVIRLQPEGKQPAIDPTPSVKSSLHSSTN